MKYWITKLAICIVLLYSLLLSNDYAGANQLSNTSNINVQQLNALPIVENVASTDKNIAEIKKEDFCRFNGIVNRIDKLEGIFTLYCSEDSGKVFLELKPEQLNKNYLAIVTLESGIGESGIYSGLPLSDFIFYFRRINNRLHFVVRNVKFRTDSIPEQRSLARSFSDSVLYSLEIATIDPKNQNILINLNELLMQDFPGLTPLLKYSLQADYRLDARKSYFGDVNSFPENIEIDSIYGFSSLEGSNLITVPDSRALTLKVHYSFSQLRENNGYIPRLADDRVGYFTTAFQDFSDNNARESFVRYINRWHLEPSNPSAPLSSPKKPIVYWIENAVPLKYRDAIREGVLMWNKAFEKAGFQNAIEVQQMPDDADWKPADVHYNTIRWFNSLDAGFAKGPMRVNPFTGEILDADIIVDANMVRLVQQEYHALMEANSCPEKMKGHEDAGKYLDRFFASSSSALFFSSESCYGMESSNQAAMGALALSMLPNTTPSSESIKEYVHQYLRSLIAHEVGHTLGLHHNFYGSTMLAPQELNNTEITHTKGLVGSVMDYVPVNIAPQGIQQGDYFPGVIGPYDEWAIEYGYKKFPATGLKVTIPESEKSFLNQIALASPQPELSYATDEDIWDINPLANVWDMSSDVLLYSQWQMDNARFMWQRLDQGYLSKRESYSNLRLKFNGVLKYYFRNATLLSKYIGGQSFRRLHTSDDAWAFVPVSLLKQRQALTKLQEYVFAEDAFSFSPQLLNQLAPSHWGDWGSSAPNNRLDYPIHDRILSFQSAILRSLLDSDRLNRLQDIELKTLPGEALSIPELFDTLQTGIWTEVFAPGEPKPISSIRRSLQREHLNILLQMMLGTTNTPEDGRTLAWYKLRQLQKAIDVRLKQLGESLDIYTLAHLEASGDRITKALNAQFLSR
ncbi:zinc-dependent metalloprotease [Nostoc sp. 'Lobaria pulmonaria (5183) cyanobiont']|uniref:zinc-dependent metalloprotease n=1 Tax=Nostoc sp. 'Lobaria pulmonaria (5183) cyanobiont' TaxID=1618022 RepID=UPI000CF350B8|nr:zinc-dependent metalloprotease [Nostoc sp. 'Lobaria pulmonaria (5183) cyanobiont']AVH73185.1 Zn-dependent metalloprotease [Nostoc sp. 'Lobaria pulmonaria (5183) cyanobiont']